MRKVGAVQPNGSVVRLRLIGANHSPTAAAGNALPGLSNYFIGNNKEKWRANIENYQRVRYRGVYPGIDLCYYGNQRNLEHDFIVAPGATFLAGSNSDSGVSIAVDSVGNAYVAGETSSLDFPVTPGAFLTAPETPMSPAGLGRASLRHRERFRSTIIIKMLSSPN